MIYGINGILLVFYRFDGNVGFVIPLFAEFNCAVDHGEQCVIFAYSHIAAGVMDSSPLPYDDIAGFYHLATIKFYAQSFAL